MTSVVYQAEAAECGLACLAMVSSRFGRHTDITALRAKAGSFPRGMTVRDLIEVASKIGIEARAIRLEVNEIKDLEMPAILHWEMSHFVVAESAAPGGSILISDPARGQRKVAPDVISRAFTGIAVEFALKPDFERKDERTKINLWKLWKGKENVVPAFAKVMLLSTFIEVIGLSAPLVLQLITDELIPSKSIGFAVVCGVAALALLLSQVAGHAFRFRALEALRLNLNLRVSSGLFSHLLNLPSSFFASRHHGDIQSRFSSLDEIHSGISGAVLAAIFDAVVALLVAALLFLYSPIVGVLSVVCVIAYVATRSLMHAPTMAAHEGQIISQARRQSFLLESLRGIETLKAYSALQVRSAEFSNMTAEAASDEFRVSRLSNVYQSISASIVAVALIGAMLLGAWEVMRGSITLGMLVALLMYRATFMQRMFAAFDAFMRVRMLSLHAHRVSEVSTQAVESTATLPGRSLGGSKIVASSLAFAYPGAKGPAFAGVSFSIESGASVGVIGRSGSGKTTLGKIICGLLKPTAGHLSIGGEDVLGEEAILRHSIAVVSQSDVMFSGTILQNITMWDPLIDLSRVNEACRNACILDDILKLPLGLNSPAGENGNLLSGGQKQRIFLARALYKDPAILILDEATSHLDIPTEGQVLEHLAKLSITRIHIAHRPQSIAFCNQIIDLGGGLHEEGTMAHISEIA